MDPNAAVLFVVDAYINHLAITSNSGYPFLNSCCLSGICGADLLVDYDAALSQSQWFRRHGGRDHVLVASSPEETISILSDLNLNALSAANRISFETNTISNGRLWIASTYVGRKCQPQSKTVDVSFIGALHPDRVSHELRRQACKWLSNQTDVTAGACGEGDQCPVVGQSRLGLHIRGDTVGANRLVDILLSESVPVLTNARQKNVLPLFLPWDKMTFLVDSDNSSLNHEASLPTVSGSHFVSSLKHILDNGYYAEVHKFNQEHCISSLLDWEANAHMAELYMAAFQTFVIQSGDIAVRYAGNFTTIHGCASDFLFCTNKEKSICKAE
jgi:hypothetical protein